MNYLSLIRDTIVNIDISHSKVCELCDIRYQKLIKVTTSNSSEYNLCELCKAVWVYDKNDTYKIVMLQSSLDQVEIIKKTVNLFNTNGCIPSPSEIDPDTKSINMSSQNLKYILFHNKELGKTFSNKNFKIFITPDVNMDKIVIRNMFSQSNVINNGYWENIKQMDTYKIPKKIKKKINEYVQSARNIQEIESSRKIFNKKTSDLNDLLEKISEFSETHCR